MTLSLFLLVAVVVYIPLQYFLIPRLETQAATGRTTVARSAILAVSTYLSTTAFLAAFTYLLFLILMFVLSLTNPVSSNELGGAVARIQWFQSRYKIFREFWAIWLFVMLLLAIVAYRREKNAAAHKREVKELPYLPPNEEMKEVSRQITECAQRAKRLEQSWVGTDGELKIRLDEFKREGEKLEFRLHEADMRRRMLLPATGQGLFAKLRQIIGSRGFFKTLQTSTKSLGYIGTVLLALCIVGVSVPVLDGQLEDRVLHLDELQVELSKEEARKSFAEVMSEPKDPAAAPLSQEDEQVIQDTARLVEQFFMSSTDWQADKEDDKKYIPYFVRSQVVRDQIVAEFKRNPPDIGPPDKGGPNAGAPPNNGGGPKSGGSAPKGTSGRNNGESERGGGGSPNAGGPDIGSGRVGGGSANGSATDNGGGPKPRGTSPATDQPPYSLRDRITRHDGGPQSAFGESVADSLRKGLTGRPHLLAKLKAKLAEFKASFREPLVPLDLQKFAFAEAFGVVVDSSWQPPNELAAQVQKVGRTAFKDVAANIFARARRSGTTTFEKTAKRVYQSLMCRFFADVAGPKSLGDTLARVRDGVAQQPVMTHEETAALREVATDLPANEKLFTELVDSYKKNPSAMAYDETELSENQKHAEQLRREFFQHSRKPTAEDISRVDSYEDRFPGRLGIDTPKSKVVSDTHSSQLSPDNPTKLLAESRDFSSLQQSSKLGGILMGRSPNSATGDFRDLRWTTNNEVITLYLRRADGSEIVAGPFEKALVHQALAYVADDRKVVATIILAGNNSRRVLLHPAFVDTRLGQNIIEFDKLVFRFLTNCDPDVKHWNKLIYGQITLYQIALALRRISALQEWDSEGRLTAEGRRDLTNMAALERRVFNDPKTRDYLQAAIQDPAALKLPERSALAWGKAFFEPSLVDSLSSCASQSRGDLPAFHECLSSLLREDAEQASVGTMKEWFKQAPDLSPRSIAEELSYDSDKDLSFMKHESSWSAEDKLWPFQFRYEVAFPRKTSDDRDATSDQRKPWEFLQLRDLIANKVSAGVEADAQLQSLYKRMRDFTLLQRLFRTSVEGKLGDEFPIEKLTTLMTATRGSVATVSTPRWDNTESDKCR